MAWIESHQNLIDHPKTRRAAKILDIDVILMLGHLHVLWHWAISYAEDGDLTDFTSDEVAYGARWHGDPDKFVEALIQAGWIDRSSEAMSLHDWWDYAGKLVEQRKANAERMRQRRAKSTAHHHEETPDGSNSSFIEDAYSARAGNVQDTLPARAPATVPNRTLPYSTLPNTTTIGSNDSVAITNTEVARARQDEESIPPIKERPLIPPNGSGTARDIAVIFADKSTPYPMELLPENVAGIARKLAEWIPEAEKKGITIHPVNAAYDCVEWKRSHKTKVKSWVLTYGNWLKNAANPPAWARSSHHSLPTSEPLEVITCTPEERAALQEIYSRPMHPPSPLRRPAFHDS